MTANELARYLKKLLALRDELMGKGPHKIEPNRTNDATVGEDEDEQPLNEMLQTIASSRNRNAAQTVAQIDKALRKIRQNPDDFGLCEECEEELDAGRLEAIPYVELCVDCRAKRDGKRGGVRRHLLDFK